MTAIEPNSVWERELHKDPVSYPARWELVTVTWVTGNLVAYRVGTTRAGQPRAPA